MAEPHIQKLRIRVIKKQRYKVTPFCVRGRAVGSHIGHRAAGSHAPDMIAELFATIGQSRDAVDLPRLAKLATGLLVSGSAALVVHAKSPRRPPEHSSAAVKAGSFEP